MKKLLASAAIIAVITVATNAVADDSASGHRTFPYWYLGLSGGGAMQQDSHIAGSNRDINWDAGYVLSASIGYQHPSLLGFRPEVEYSYHRQDITNGESRVSGVAANLYYDFYNSTIITPYIGGGLGYSNFHLSNGPGGGATGTDTQAIYQGMVGLGYEPVSIPNVGLTLGYRYMAPFSDPNAGGHKYDYDNHSIEAGAKFRF